MNLLNDRKIKILEAIIRDYIATAEPIGSRTIAKKFDLGISSATIRNEMSDLEEMGLIIQPHASAGRVPSDKGYRFYVDSLMKLRELTDRESIFIEQLINSNISHIDYLMRETAKAISLLTNYTTIVSEPKAHETKIKHLQIMPYDDYSILLVLVTNEKSIKNHVLRIEKVLDSEERAKISALLNVHLSDVHAVNINDEFVSSIEQELGEHAYLVKPVVSAVLNTIISENDVQIYTSGVKNLLDFPEFSNLDRMRALFDAFEEKQTLIKLLHGSGEDSIQIIIGSENDNENMQNCSLIRACYSIGGQVFGNIGIIGPTRMDYPQVVSVLDKIVRDIEGVIKSGYKKGG